MRVIIETLNLHSDARGPVVEPLDAAGLAAQKNIHVAISQPGCVRGNHYHQLGTEIITVIGPALARFREGEEISDVPIAANEAVRFTIPPGVSHAIKNTGAQPCVMVAFNTILHDRNAPDVFRDVLIDS
ncbi:MAG: UDP-2-acetamido-2,6-beta-L-arabino-hexul-4-ose reductase [Blastocatellia bacterium]